MLVSVSEIKGKENELCKQRRVAGDEVLPF